MCRWNGSVESCWEVLLDALFWWSWWWLPRQLVLFLLTNRIEHVINFLSSISATEETSFIPFVLLGWTTFHAKKLDTKWPFFMLGEISHFWIVIIVKAENVSKHILE